MKGRRVEGCVVDSEIGTLVESLRDRTLLTIGLTSSAWTNLSCEANSTLMDSRLTSSTVPEACSAKGLFKVSGL